MSFTFSFGDPRDIGPVKRLLADCGLPGDDAGNHIEHFLIARSGDELAGTVGLELAGSSALLRSLAVGNAYRGKGLAKLLYERILPYARAKGVETLYLLTLSAGDFFRRRGFKAAERSSAPEQIAATQQFTTLCPDTAEFLARDIRDDRQKGQDMSDQPLNVLFLCTGNSARSIMAEAILNATGGDRFRAYSAGSHPNGKVNAFALAQIGKAGLSTEGYRSKSWDEFAVPGAPKIDFVFTVCSDAAGEVCPMWPGHPVTAHWGVDDPASFKGTDDEKARFFSRIYGQLHARIRILTSLPLDKLERPALQKKLDEAGQS
jgi:protein-tyrosine-phosphatase/N-acetylglutamate synthase-like GNAT family acetyltransferase